MAEPGVKPPPHGLTLRPITDSDLPFLLSLYCSFRAEEMARAPWPHAQKDAFLADQFRLQHSHFARQHPRADFWMVERRRAPIGRLYLDRSGPLWRVIDIGFLPKDRSRGVGRALLAWAQDSARAAGAEGLDLHVLTTNPRAEALYRRLGFEAAGDAGARRRMIWRP